MDVFGMAIMVAALVGFLLFRAELRRRNLGTSQNHVALLYVILLCGLVGTKLGGIPDDWEKFREAPWDYLFDPRGHAFWGALIGGLGGAIVYARWAKLPVLAMLDALCPSLILGYAIGRIACHITGDGCYGTPTDLPWAACYPEGSVPTTEYVHPTPIYEALIALGIFVALWSLRKSLRASGWLFGLYLTLAALERFGIEFIRRNPKYAGLSPAQWIAIALFILGTWLLFKRGKASSSTECRKMETTSSSLEGR